jgi:hypothetical protein
MPQNRADVANRPSDDSTGESSLHLGNFLVAKNLTSDVRCTPQKHLPSAFVPKLLSFRSTQFEIVGVHLVLSPLGAWIVTQTG